MTEDEVDRTARLEDERQVRLVGGIGFILGSLPLVGVLLALPDIFALMATDDVTGVGLLGLAVVALSVGILMLKPWARRPGIALCLLLVPVTFSMSFRAMKAFSHEAIWLPYHKTLMARTEHLTPRTGAATLAIGGLFLFGLQWLYAQLIVSLLADF